MQKKERKTIAHVMTTYAGDGCGVNEVLIKPFIKLIKLSECAPIVSCLIKFWLKSGR